MALKDMKTGALEGVRSIVQTVERAFQEPWELTSARLLGSEWSPRLEVKETEKDVIVTAGLPGLDKDDLHVSATEDSLSIRGLKITEEPAHEDERRAKDRDVKKTETRESFYRSISLPATVRPDDVKAHYKDGTLTITLPKAKHTRVKRVPID